MESGKCAVCNVPAPFKCTACKSVSYCGVDHQKVHWKIHKKDCRTHEINESPELGRYIVASKNIRAKSIIFSESPLVVGPKWCIEQHEKDIPIFPCVGCFKPVSIGTGKCPSCAWPACSAQCTGLHDPLLHGLECVILRTDKGPENLNDRTIALDYYRSDILLTLRCLMLFSKYPQKWKQLMELQSHDTERRGTKYYQEAETRIISFLKLKFLDKYKKSAENKIPMPECSGPEMHKICGILEVNALNVSLPSGQEISAFYPIACLLEHSCIPNCYFTFDFTKNFRINMIAGRDIRKGEHLAIMYTHMLWGTQTRREHLLTNKYFVCQCTRCIDPTELGTYISALKCIGDEGKICETGILLPLDPIANDTDWKCDKCPVQIGNDQVTFLMANIEEEVDGIMSRPSATVHELEEIISKLQQILHENHYHLFALKHSLIQLYGNQNGYQHDQLSAEQLTHKISMCKNLLSIVDTIDPFAIRLSMYTGIILYELHLAIVEREKRQMAMIKCSPNAVYDYEELHNAERFLIRAKNVLDNNLDIPQGKKFISAVVKASEELEKMFAEIQI